MLKGIDPLLGPELLGLLRAMGHGDEIALVDGNYPALTDARRLIRTDGHGLIPVLRAVLSVLPIDTSVPQAIFRAVNAATPDKPDTIHRMVEEAVAEFEPDHAVIPLPPSEFYARVKACHAIIATSEPRFYGNVILRKGVVGFSD